MESYGIPCYIYRDGQPERVVCKLTTDEFQGTKPRYRPDFREPYLYTIFVLHTLITNLSFYLSNFGHLYFVYSVPEYYNFNTIYHYMLFYHATFMLWQHLILWHYLDAERAWLCCDQLGYKYLRFSHFSRSL